MKRLHCSTEKDKSMYPCSPYKTEEFLLLESHRIMQEAHPMFPGFPIHAPQTYPGCTGYLQHLPHMEHCMFLLLE